MTFHEPSFLWIAAAAPLAVLLGWWRIARSRRLLRRFSEAVAPRAARSWFAVVAEAGALALIALALAGPDRSRDAGDLGAADVMIALDVSLSMSAADEPPDRLDRARREVKVLLERLAADSAASPAFDQAGNSGRGRQAPGRRAGISTFAGSARIVCPLTDDLEAAAAALDRAAAEPPAREGTDLAAGLQASIAALGPPVFIHGGSSPRRAPCRAVVVVTDGEHRAGEERWREAVALAARDGVRVAGLVIGTPEGARIPAPGGGFVADPGGSEILTGSRTGPLAQAAAATGGICIEARDFAFPMDALYNRLAAAIAGGREAEPAAQSGALFQAFVCGALLLSLAARCLPPGSAIAGVKPALRFAVAACVALSLPGCGDPASGAARRGNDLFRSGDYAAAVNAYSQSLKIKPDAPAVLLNRGLASYRLGALDQALDDLARASGAAGERGRDAPAAAAARAARFGRAIVLYRMAEAAFLKPYAPEAELGAALDRAGEAASLFEQCREDGTLPEMAADNAAAARALTALLEKRLTRFPARAEDAAGRPAAAAGDRPGAAESSGGGQPAEAVAGGEAGAVEPAHQAPHEDIWSAGASGDPDPLTPEARRRIFARLEELKSARDERAAQREAERKTRGGDW